MKAIPMLEELQGPDDLDLALLYNKVGHRQFRLSNYEEALENYGKAVNIFIKNYGQDHPDVATIYDNMAPIIRIWWVHTKTLARFIMYWMIRRQA